MEFRYLLLGMKLQNGEWFQGDSVEIPCSYDCRSMYSVLIKVFERVKSLYLLDNYRGQVIEITRQNLREYKKELEYGYILGVCNQLEYEENVGSYKVKPCTSYENVCSLYVGMGQRGKNLIVWDGTYYEDSYYMPNEIVFENPLLVEKYLKEIPCYMICKDWLEETFQGVDIKRMVYEESGLAELMFEINIESKSRESVENLFITRSQGVFRKENTKFLWRERLGELVIKVRLPQEQLKDKIMIKGTMHDALRTYRMLAKTKKE